VGSVGDILRTPNFKFVSQYVIERQKWRGQAVLDLKHLPPLPRRIKIHGGNGLQNVNPIRFDPDLKHVVFVTAKVRR
jgi:hypothetical protein